MRAAYGKQTLKELSKVLTEEFGYESGNEEQMTYITYFKEAIKRYEQDRQYSGTSYEEFARVRSQDMFNDFGRKITYRRDEKEDKGTSEGYGLGRQKQIRYSFEEDIRDEQESGRDNTESGKGESGAVRYTII